MKRFKAPEKETDEEYSERTLHPDFALNKKTSDWLCNTQADKWEDIFLRSCDNRLEIAWKDESQRNWCNPVSFNQSSEGFRNQATNALYNLKTQLSDFFS